MKKKDWGDATNKCFLNWTQIAALLFYIKRWYKMLYKNTLTFFQKNKCDCPHCYLSPCTTLIVPLFVEASDVQISILNNCVRIEHSSHFNLLLITSYYTVQLGRQFCRSKALHWLLSLHKIRKFHLISWSPKNLQKGVFPENFHTVKFNEISVFCALYNRT